MSPSYKRVGLSRATILTTRLRRLLAPRMARVAGWSALGSAIVLLVSATIIDTDGPLAWAIFAVGLMSTAVLGLIAFLATFDASDVQTRLDLLTKNQDSATELVREIHTRLEDLERNLKAHEDREQPK